MIEKSIIMFVGYLFGVIVTVLIMLVVNIKIPKRSRYYLISYAHPTGFGQIYFEVTGGELDIRRAQKTIAKKNSLKRRENIAIITINKIKKSQYEN